MKRFTILVLFGIMATSCQQTNTLDPEVIKPELDSIMILDQKYRNQLMSVYQEEGEDSKAFKELLEKQMKIDSANLVYVEDLIVRYGKYPGKSLVGNEYKDVAFFVLQHNPDSIQQRYLDLILKAAREGELDKGSAAMFYDRYLIGIGEPQMYGSQVGRKITLDSLTGISEEKIFIYPIKDTTAIDSIRMWNGLSPLEGYLNNFGLSRWNEADYKN